MKILAAGDLFVTTDLLSRTIQEEIPGAEIATISNDWPRTPFRTVDDVDEAAGNVDELIAALQGVDGCVTHTFPFTEQVFANCPDLRVVGVCRGGPVNVNLAAASRFGVAVRRAPGRNAISTAEHTVAMILASVRNLATRHRELVEGRWNSEVYVFDDVPISISGARVGVVGLGAVGELVAAYMHALGAQVVVFDPFRLEAFPDYVHVVDDLESLLRACDILTVHARPSADGSFLIGASELSLLHDGTFVINCARGALLDYDAMARELATGRLSGFACDVFPTEPVRVSELILTAPNVLFTPHMAGASKGAAKFGARVAARSVAAFLRGESAKTPA